MSVRSVSKLRTQLRRDTRTEPGGTRVRGLASNEYPVLLFALHLKAVEIRLQGGFPVPVRTPPGPAEAR